MKNSQEDLITLHNLGVKGRPANSPAIIQVRWNFPPQGWTKVNIDGAAKGAPGKAGCGGIFRNCRGFIKGCFSFHLGIRFAFEAEIMGFIMALEFAHQFDWNNLWVETDSSYVALLFKNQSHQVPWVFRNRWIRALKYAKELNTRVSHTFREGNCVADKLAALALASETRMWWNGAPENIKRLSYRDMMPMPFYRFRN